MNTATPSQPSENLSGPEIAQALAVIVQVIGRQLDKKRLADDMRLICNSTIQRNIRPGLKSLLSDVADLADVMRNT